MFHVKHSPRAACQNLPPRKSFPTATIAIALSSNPSFATLHLRALQTNVSRETFAYTRAATSLEALASPTPDAVPHARGAPRPGRLAARASRRAPRSARARISRPRSRPSRRRHLPRPAPRTPLAASSRLTTAAIPRAPLTTAAIPRAPPSRRLTHPSRLARYRHRASRLSRLQARLQALLALSKTHDLTISTRPQSHYPLRCPYRRAEGSLWIISRSPSGRPLTDS